MTDLSKIGPGTMSGLSLLRQAQLENATRGVDNKQDGSREDLPPTKDVDKAATDFEAMLLGQMLKSMWSTVQGPGLISGSREEGMYRDMLNEALSKEIADGQGIGIKEVIKRDLLKREK